MIGVPQYLLTLYIAEREDDEESLIPPGYVTGAPDRLPPVTTECLQNLDAKEPVDYEPYEGVTLTVERRDVVADLYDIYQILSRFCRDVLGVNDHEGEAMQLVENVSSAVAKYLPATLFRDDGDRDGARQMAGSESAPSPDNLVS